MEGLIRAGGVMERLIRDRWSDGGTHKGRWRDGGTHKGRMDGVMEGLITGRWRDGRTHKGQMEGWRD